MLNIPDWNKDDYDWEREEYPDYEREEYPDYEEEWNLEDSIQDSIWRGCIEDK